MLIPSQLAKTGVSTPSLSRRVNANSQQGNMVDFITAKLIKKGEC